MARPVKKESEQWKNEILSAAQKLFLSKGYMETSISDIMDAVGGAKGMFYRFFESKEEVMSLLGDKMFFENNPFETIQKRTDLNGLEKIRELLRLNQADAQREQLNLQAMSILKDPHILMAAIESNCRVLTPLWFALIQEGIQDGSIHTQYPAEISQLLPLVGFWLLPSVFPATEQEISHKFHFISEVFAKMGLPIYDEKLMETVEKQISIISANAEQGGMET